MENEILINVKSVDFLLKNVEKLTLKKNQTKIVELLQNVIQSLTNNEVKIKNLDQHQLWAYIENSTKHLTKNYKDMTSQNIDQTIMKELKETKKELEKHMLSNKREREDNEDIEEGDDIENEEDIGEDEENDHENEDGINTGKDFFDMDEFNKIGDEDFDIKPEGDDQDDDDLDEEAELDEDIEKKEFKYEDFFDKPGKDTTNDADEEYNDDEIENNLFDIEDKIIKQDKEGIENDYFINENVTESIEEIEKKMMEVKAWHMKGEVRARQRPKESLLENFLDFQVSIKPPPVPTAEGSDRIEKIIKMRIKEELFDDPIRKSQINLNKKDKSEIEMDFDKSKKGLGELYEDDYNENVLKIASETDQVTVKKELDELFTKLYNVFDKLTNNNFVSGSRSAEMKVITNVPAIQMEDISQFVSDNTNATKSANELFSRKDMETKTKDENTVKDNKADHKRWKRNVRTKLREKERNKKLKEYGKSFDSKFEAKIAIKQDKDRRAKKNVKNSELKSSKFFGNLQNIVSDDVNKKNSKKFKSEENKNIKSFKL